MMELLVDKLNQAHQYKKDFRLQEAVELYNECAEIDPSCVIASAQAGLCSLVLGETDQAETFLSNAFSASKKTDILVGSYLVATLSANDHQNQAKQILQECIAVDPEFDFAESYMLTAEMLTEKQKHTEALRLIDTLSRAFGETDWFKVPRNHYRLIRVLANAEVFDVAELLANSLVTMTPKSWEGIASLSAIACAKKQFDVAYTYTIAALKKGGTIDPLLEAQEHWLALNK